MNLNQKIAQLKKKRKQYLLTLNPNQRLDPVFFLEQFDHVEPIGYFHGSPVQDIDSSYFLLLKLNGQRISIPCKKKTWIPAEIIRQTRNDRSGVGETFFIEGEWADSQTLCDFLFFHLPEEKQKMLYTEYFQQTKFDEFPFSFVSLFQECTEVLFHKILFDQLCVKSVEVAKVPTEETFSGADLALRSRFTFFNLTVTSDFLFEKISKDHPAEFIRPRNLTNRSRENNLFFYYLQKMEDHFTQLGYGVPYSHKRNWYDAHKFEEDDIKLFLSNELANFYRTSKKFRLTHMFSAESF